MGNFMSKTSYRQYIIDYRPELKSFEVRLEFEAVLLDINEDQKNQLWIHAKIKACVSKKDCDAVSNFTYLSKSE